jgi:hypothetical protein
MRTWRPISCPPSQTEVSVRRAVERPLGRWNRHVCGHYQRRSDKQRISEAFSLGNVDGLSLDVHHERRSTIRPGWRVASLRSPDRKTENTFAIITVEPNELVAEKTGHDRMPLIVKRTDYQRIDDAVASPIISAMRITGVFQQEIKVGLSDYRLSAQR